MDYFLLVASLTLFLQLGVFLLLVAGYLFKKGSRFRWHGLSMFVGVVLHLVSIAVIMVPSFVVGLVPSIAEKPFDAVSLITVVHVVFGITAAVFGVWIVSSWRLRRSLRYCAPKRKWMRFTFLVWSGALAIGFVLYLVLFWSLLFA